MKIRTLSVLLCAMLFISCGTSESSNNSLTYIMDMVHKNPGEPYQDTKYRNPHYLVEQGYNTIVPQFYVQCALTYDEFDKDLIPEGSKEREWILERRELVRREIKAAKDAGLQVFPFTDMLVLPTLLLEKYKNELVDKKDLESGHDSVHGKMAPNIEHDMTAEVIKAQIKEIFELFPELDGLVVRFGETYLYDTPYHGGGSPVRGGGEQGIAGHVKLIELLKAEICEKYNKKLFYRTWDFGFLHTNAEVFKAVTDQVEPHKNLTFSIKYTCGDFHRLTQFNPTIGVGKHPYIIEFQAQPEYYGKGAHPVYVFGGMLNGFSEYSRNMKPGDIQSVAQLKGDPRFQGLWTWSRGGGWRGPYLENEFWCDLNAHAAAIWAADTTQSESAVLDKTLAGFGVDKGSLADFKKLLHTADEAVLKGQCTDLDIPFNVWWTRDQYFSDASNLSEFFKTVVQSGRADEVIAEKSEAVALWGRILALADKIKISDPQIKDYLVVSAKYGRIKFDIIRQIFIMCVNSKEYELSGTMDKEAVKSAIERYDALWIEWERLKEDNPSCATLYEPNGFNIAADKGAFGRAENGIVRVVDSLRELVK